MVCSDIYRNFWSRVRFGVRVGSQELGGLAGWTCAELESTWLPVNPTVTCLSPELVKERYIHHLEEEKNNKKPHECAIWSYMARLHITRLPGLQRNEYQGVQRTWQGRDSGEGRAGCRKSDGDDAPFWGAGSWGLDRLQPSTLLSGGRHERKGSSDRKAAKSIWTQSTALIS